MALNEYAGTSNYQTDDLSGEAYIRLNVGGALFQTSSGTLTKRDTMLRAMFSGRIPLRRDADGWVIIDRSGRHFGLVLDFLRDGSIPLPPCRYEVEQILNEAKYYLIQDLAEICSTWLSAQRRSDTTLPSICYLPTVNTKQEVEAIINANKKPVIKFMINRHNNKYSYTSQSDDNILKNLELFDRLCIKFHDRIVFVKDLGSESSEVCQWKFYGKGILRAEVCCTSIVYATDKKQTKVEFPDSKIYDEAMCILRYEEPGLCVRCGGDCSAHSTPTGPHPPRPFDEPP
ncbi:unnamed protein product, partial [Mesorhabditis belari]|uniref:BTB domain-containing protein n=1 Tax=Mesorhabditis belari TaxID=2138241 RepID=A0AAF3J1V1_9BILA